MQLEARGVPTVVFATEAFASLTQQVLRSCGLSDGRVVVVPHPLGGITATEAEANGRNTTDALLAVLS